MKKLLAMILALVLGLSLFSTTALAADDMPTILIECLYFDAIPRDLQAVEEAMNKISTEKIGVKVELYPLGFMDASQQVSLMISSNAQLDLIVCPNRPDFLSLVNKNMLLELDDLLDQYGQGIKEEVPNAIPGGLVGNTLYGIPGLEKYGSINGLCIVKEVVDATGWTKFDNLTMEDMTEFLAKAKEVTSLDPIHLSGGGNAVANFEMMNTVDYLGADAACGGLLGVGKTTVIRQLLQHGYEAYRVVIIENEIGYPITMVSNGPSREDIIYRKSALKK